MFHAFRSLLVAATFAITLSSFVAAQDPLKAYRAEAEEKWANDMKRIAKLDATEPDPEHAILYIGSSSIRLWKEVGEDMKPWPAINRGYGGAKFSDLAVMADRIVSPHKFDALVIYVGNDVTGGKADKTTEEVVRLFEHVVATVRAKFADQPIFLVEITPAPVRFAAWPKIKEANAALKEACSKGKNLHFISTSDRYLDAQGGPMPELFRDDKLHQNRDGYARWSKIIREALEKVLPAPVSTQAPASAPAK